MRFLALLSEAKTMDFSTSTAASALPETMQETMPETMPETMLEMVMKADVIVERLREMGQTSERQGCEGKV